LTDGRLVGVSGHAQHFPPLVAPTAQQQRRVVRRGRKAQEELGENTFQRVLLRDHLVLFQGAPQVGDRELRGAEIVERVVVFAAAKDAALAAPVKDDLCRALEHVLVDLQARRAHGGHDPSQVSLNGLGLRRKSSLCHRDVLSGRIALFHLAFLLTPRRYLV
jgi:hypothetical protein